MVVHCPHCPAKLNVPSLPSADTPIRCPRCKAVFTASKPPEDEPVALDPVEPEPGAEPAAAGNDFEFPDAPPEREVEEKVERSERRSGKHRAAAAPPKKFPTLIVAGGLGAVIAVTALVLVLTGGGSKPTANNEPPPGPAPKGKDTPKGTPKKDPAAAKAPSIPDDLKELFTQTIDRPAPTVQIPMLQKVGAAELVAPPFGTKAEPPPPDAGKMTLDEIKKATAFIKVVTPDGGGTGSGFVIRGDESAVLLATNHHVVTAKSSIPVGSARVSVVFDSGLPTEYEAPADIIASDAEVDLAILRVTRSMRVPKPIDPEFAVKPSETMTAVAVGFPLGSSLALGARNPNVTLVKGTVSSIRLDTSGKPTFIQLDAAVYPGNSGGPVVDADGRLVGVAVAKIKDSNIALAVPVPELTALLGGRVSPPVLLPAGQDGRFATFKVVAPVADPLKKVKDVVLHVVTGDTLPPVAKEPDGTWKAIPGASQLELAMTARQASGDLKIAAAGTKGTQALLQLEVRSADGASAFSPPVPHRLVFDSAQTATDAIPMETFRRNLASYAGQVVVVRGKISSAASRRGAYYEVPVTDDADASPDGLVFVADREVGTQLNELAPDDLALPVRLTLRVGKAPAGKATAARVTRVDLIGRGNRLVRTLPSNDAPSDQLVALNRAPDKYVGQTLTFLAILSPAVLGREADPELSVMMLTEQKPENLHFSTSPVIAAKLKDPALQSTLHVAQLTVRVENKELDGSGPRIVTVTRIEILGRGGKSDRVIE